MRGALLGEASEAEHAVPLDLQDVAAYEQFLSVAGLHEGAIRALVDQHELSATDLEGRVTRIPAVWFAMFIILCAYATSAGTA